MYYRRGIDDSEFVSQAVTRERARIDAAITKFLLDRVWWKGGRQVCPVCDNVFGKVAYDWAMSCGFWDVYFTHGVWGPACRMKLYAHTIEVRREAGADPDGYYRADWKYQPWDIDSLVRLLQAMAGVRNG
jgi:hypothetical protein